MGESISAVWGMWLLCASPNRNRHHQPEQPRAPSVELPSVGGLGFVLDFVDDSRENSWIGTVLSQEETGHSASRVRFRRRVESLSWSQTIGVVFYSALFCC